MESCILILYIYWKNTVHAQKISFNYGFLLISLFWQVYLCFLSIAFVKSRGRGHGQVCPGKDRPYSPELSWSCKGYTRFVLQSNTVLVTASQPPPWKKSGGSPVVFPQLKHYCRPESLFALVHSEQDGPPDCCFLNVFFIIIVIIIIITLEGWFLFWRFKSKFLN